MFTHINLLSFTQDTVIEYLLHNISSYEDSDRTQLIIYFSMFRWIHIYQYITLYNRLFDSHMLTLPILEQINSIKKK